MLHKCGTMQHKCVYAHYYHDAIACQQCQEMINLNFQIINWEGNNGYQKTIIPGRYKVRGWYENTALQSVAEVLSCHEWS